LKKLNSLDKKSFLIGLVSGAGIIATSITISILVANSLTSPPMQEEEAQKSFAEIVGHCFDSYNEGIDMLSTYSKEIEIRTFFPTLERENVTKEQIVCSLEALSFSKSDAEGLFVERSGRIDNDDFQVKWKAMPTCQAKDGSSEGRNPFCSKSQQSFETVDLFIYLKDFRP
jgi:hypothetical protein